MMIIMPQVDLEAQDSNFHPPFLVGDPEVLDPYTGALLPSYGITDSDSDNRIHQVYLLWAKSNGASNPRGLVPFPG